MMSADRGLGIGLRIVGLGLRVYCCCPLIERELSIEDDRCECTGEFAGSGLRLRMLLPKPAKEEGMLIEASDRLRRFWW